MVLVIVVTMTRARDSVRQSLATPEAKAAWEEWRNAARESSEGQGPVRRKEPKSNDPPALILLSDPGYFVISLVTAIIFSSLLFIVTMFLLRGIFTPPQLPGDK